MCVECMFNVCLMCVVCVLNVRGGRPRGTWAGGPYGRAGRWWRSDLVRAGWVTGGDGRVAGNGPRIPDMVARAGGTYAGGGGQQWWGLSGKRADYTHTQE